MPYNDVAFKALVEMNSNVNIHVVSWGEKKKISNYRSPSHDRIVYYNKDVLTLNDIVSIYSDTKPKLLYVSGRMENDYLKVCLIAKKDGVIRVGNSDNQYFGFFRQRLAILFSSILYKRYFDYMMLPGMYQYEYYRRMGFDRNKIVFPQYSADVKLFSENYADGDIRIKDTILFIGRLEKVKGVELLLSVYSDLRGQNLINDKLLVVGRGSLKDYLDFNIEGVEYVEYLTQEDLKQKLKSVKYFCLPSRYEPWGVVIHEAAAAGLPLLLSDACGANVAFLREGYNGYSFSIDQRKEFLRLITKMSNLSQPELKLMGRRSYELAKTITPEMWACQINTLMN